MPVDTTGRTRVFAVIGDPIEHSLSPAMYNAAFRVLGIDAVYVPYRVPQVSLGQVLSALEALAIGGNVTVPHKVQAGKLIVRLTPVAKELECVNTFWLEEGRFRGDNTDVDGVLDSATRLHAAGPWLLAGTGGAARAVAAAARESEVKLLVRSRDDVRAREFAKWAANIGVDAEPDDGAPCGLVINATPLGLIDNDPRPFPEGRIIGCRAALDLVYRRGGTRWIRRCSNMGMRVLDGRHMLVAQGARAFERFYPQHKAPRDAMAAAIERALEAR